MCGIFFVQTKKGFEKIHQEGLKGVLDAFYSFKYRGPDRSRHKRQILSDESEQFIGFHRLAINGLSQSGDQPITCYPKKGQILDVVCNGEIYNYKELAEEFEISLSEGCSDCESIPKLYLKIGMEETIKRLDGVFAFVLSHDGKIYVGRDAIGVRPLFILWGTHEIVISSEAKGCEGFLIPGTARQIEPGTLTTLNIGGNTATATVYKWWEVSDPYMDCGKQILISTLNQLLIEATSKRLMSERPIGCLLSGGLDSSIIAAILAEKVEGLRTFSIGFTADSTDLKAARKVADRLQTNHTEIVIPFEEALTAIPEVIKATETYDITTIRASTGMFLLSKWISENTDIKVLYSGEGSDELFCGYLYFHNAPSHRELELESTRLLHELHLYDVLRADRTTAKHGLELRVPFLDKQIIKFAASLKGSVRHPVQPTEDPKFQNMEKLLLRRAFASYLPEEIVWRRKEGFSDGVSNLEKPWYVYIQESLVNQFPNLTPVQREEAYYRHLFSESFEDFSTPCPCNWMPKWTDATDPSGRVITAFDGK